MKCPFLVGKLLIFYLPNPSRYKTKLEVGRWGWGMGGRGKMGGLDCYMNKRSMNTVLPQEKEFKYHSFREVERGGGYRR